MLNFVGQYHKTKHQTRLCRRVHPVLWCHYVAVLLLYDVDHGMVQRSTKKQWAIRIAVYKPATWLNTGSY
jgi:hypothetical protein